MKPRAAKVAAGVAGAMVVLGLSELAAGLLPGSPSFVVATADAIIPHVPPWLEQLAIEIFWTYDKLALCITIVLVCLTWGACFGLLGRRGGIGLIVMAALGAICGTQALGAVVGTVIAAGLISGLAGAGTLVALTAQSTNDAQGRRRFLRWTGLSITLAGLSGSIGRWLLTDNRKVVGVLPVPATPVSPAEPSQVLDVQGVSSLITPNSEFYRIDKAVALPKLNAEEWKLKVGGLIEKSFEITYKELLSLPLREEYVTLVCVSNRVGGQLVGNARWLGVPLKELLAKGGVKSEAQQLVARGVDGFSAGFPVEAIERTLVAVGMNGEPLPYEHGYPVRLVVPGLYGYGSATKWLTEIELTTWDAYDAYWVPRGWAPHAPVKTQSRIDTPAFGDQFAAGPRKIAGVAWAPTRGIKRVEVRVDEGPWMEASLRTPLNQNTWVQWAVDWDASKGKHLLQVRATDHDNFTQIEEVTPPAPDGATGYHTVKVVVV